jgi:hypothetical protein
MPKSRRKKRPPKRVLALPDLEQSKTAVLNTLHPRAASGPTTAPSPISGGVPAVPLLVVADQAVPGTNEDPEESAPFGRNRNRARAVTEGSRCRRFRHPPGRPAPHFGREPLTSLPATPSRFHILKTQLKRPYYLEFCPQS